MNIVLFVLFLAGAAVFLLWAFNRIDGMTGLTDEDKRHYRRSRSSTSDPAPYTPSPADDTTTAVSSIFSHPQSD